MELFLVARISGRTVAIATDQIDSVVDVEDVVATPRADAAVRGLMALRSRVVTVIDTGVALGLEPTGLDHSRAVIVQVDGHHYAILVESLDDVAAFERQPLAVGLTAAQGWKRCGVALIDHFGEPVLVIDPVALLPQTALAA